MSTIMLCDLTALFGVFLEKHKHQNLTRLGRSMGTKSLCVSHVLKKRFIVYVYYVMEDFLAAKLQASVGHIGSRRDRNGENTYVYEGLLT